MSSTNLIKRLSVTLLLWALAVTTADAQRYFIEVHETLSQRQFNGKPITLLEPSVAYYLETENGHVRKYTKSDRYLPGFRKYLKRSAKRNNINLQLKELEDVVEEHPQSFQQISRFRKHLLNANAIQEHPLNREEGDAEKDNPVRNVMVKPPQVHPRFSGINQAYNTPYFAVSGYNLFKSQGADDKPWFVKSIKGEMKGFFYFIIADVRSGDIIYREVKAFEGEPDQVVLFNQLYDTFHYLKNSL